MAVFQSIMSWVIKKRIHQIDLFLKYPEGVQNDVFQTLITSAKDTEWGKKYGYSSIATYKDFQNRVPISNYNSLFPYIDRMMHGEQNILWPSKINWFAKSSGTTNTRSKFIPVSAESLENCHYKAGKDMLSLYVNNYNHSDNLFSGKTLSIGGSHYVFQNNPKICVGDVSAVILENLPLWAQIIRSPSKKTSLMEKWDEKLEQMAKEAIEQDITSMAGVPTWTLVLLQNIIKKAGANNILDIWPNLELFVHGAVSFTPYRSLFKDIIPSKGMNYLETYTASEGFFGIQDGPNNEGMLLMLDYGIFYEFMPMSEYGKDHPKTLMLNEVELDTNYALVISTNGGLWRYIIGDTIKFTHLAPYRFKITGRTKHFINAFGEEVIIENATEAITFACTNTNAQIENYTAAPIYLSKQAGGHEWLIEFKNSPSDMNQFCTLLDNRLREINSDYDAKRQNNIALNPPVIKTVPDGTFYKWMKKRGKLGGQHKVPRLSNDRDYLDDILDMIHRN